jgi:hypothetical protein
MSNVEDLNELNKYLEYIYLIILALSLLFVLIKLKFKLDLAGWIISITQLVSMIFRLSLF